MELIQKESFWVTGVVIQATFKQLWEKMPEAWDRFYKEASNIQYQKSDAFMDISFGKNQYGIYTQMIGTEVSGSEGLVPSGMQRIEIESKKYICYKHTGSLQAIADSFGKMYTWAEENEIKAGEFKLDIGYKPNQGESHHDLYIEFIE